MFNSIFKCDHWNIDSRIRAKVDEAGALPRISSWMVMGETVARMVISWMEEKSQNNLNSSTHPTLTSSKQVSQAKGSLQSKWIGMISILN